MLYIMRIIFNISNANVMDPFYHRSLIILLSIISLENDQENFTLCRSFFLTFPLHYYMPNGYTKSTISYM